MSSPPIIRDHSLLLSLHVLVQPSTQDVHGVRVLAAIPGHVIGVVLLDIAKASRKTLVGFDKLRVYLPLSCCAHGWQSELARTSPSV